MSQENPKNQQSQQNVTPKEVNVAPQAQTKAKKATEHSTTDDKEKEPKTKKPWELLNDVEQQNTTKATTDEISLMNILKMIIEFLLGKEKEKEQSQGKGAEQSQGKEAKQFVGSKDNGQASSLSNIIVTGGVGNMKPPSVTIVNTAGKEAGRGA